jgi:hypothetical protein
VARIIVRAIRNGDPPGRFIKKNEKTGLWFDVGDKKGESIVHKLLLIVDVFRLKRYNSFCDLNPDENKLLKRLHKPYERKQMKSVNN